MAQLAQLALVGAEAGADMLVAFERFLIGIDDKQTMMPVHDDAIAAGYIVDELAQTDDGGDVEDAGDDGGMAGPSAGFGGEGVDALRVQHRGFARCPIVGKDDNRLAKVAQLLAALAKQMTEDARFDVEQIGDTVGEVAALDALQCLGVAAHNSADGILDGEMLVTNERFDLLRHRRISEHERMRTEDGSVLRA